MTFEWLLRDAKSGNDEAITALLELYKPLLIKYAIIDGRLDEDLYQELCITMLRAIQLFAL